VRGLVIAARLAAALGAVATSILALNLLSLFALGLARDEALAAYFALLAALGAIGAIGIAFRRWWGPVATACQAVVFLLYPMTLGIHYSTPDPRLFWGLGALLVVSGVLLLADRNARLTRGAA